MRPFFIVGVKLIGILVLYWALQHIAPIVSSVRFFWIEVPDANIPAIDPVWNMITYLSSFLVAFLFALFLLLRGEQLAAFVPLPEVSNDASLIPPETLLQIGVVVAGLLVTCHALPRFVLDALVAISLPSSEVSLPTYTVYGESRLAESGIQLLLSWVLLFRPGRVSRLLLSRSTEDHQLVASPKRGDPGGEGCL